MSVESKWIFKQRLKKRNEITLLIIMIILSVSITLTSMTIVPHHVTTFHSYFFLRNVNICWRMKNNNFIHRRCFVYSSTVTIIWKFYYSINFPSFSFFFTTLLLLYRRAISFYYILSNNTGKCMLLYVVVCINMIKERK